MEARMHLNLTDHFSRPSLEHFTNDFQETKTQVIRSVSSITAKATIKKITQWGSSAGKWRQRRQVRA